MQQNMKQWHWRADDTGGRMVASCCEVVIFIMYLSFMNVSLLLCGTLELYYVSCVCDFVSFMTGERSQRNKNFVMLVLLQFVICDLVMITKASSCCCLDLTCRCLELMCGCS